MFFDKDYPWGFQKGGVASDPIKGHPLSYVICIHVVYEKKKAGTFWPFHDHKIPTGSRITVEP